MGQRVEEAAGGKSSCRTSRNGADMRLGDVMQQEHADMGISFVVVVVQVH